MLPNSLTSDQSKVLGSQNSMNTYDPAGIGFTPNNQQQIQQQQHLLQQLQMQQQQLLQLQQQQQQQQQQGLAGSNGPYNVSNLFEANGTMLSRSRSVSPGLFSRTMNNYRGSEGSQMEPYQDQADHSRLSLDGGGASGDRCPPGGNPASGGMESLIPTMQGLGLGGMPGMPGMPDAAMMMNGFGMMPGNPGMLPPGMMPTPAALAAVQAAQLAQVRVYEPSSPENPLSGPEARLSETETTSSLSDAALRNSNNPFTLRRRTPKQKQP
eukprot:7790803-Pyramimonas_sp.AAC.1